MSEFFDNIIKPQIYEGKAPLPDNYLTGDGAQQKDDSKSAPPIFGDMVEVNFKKGSLFRQY